MGVPLLLTWLRKRFADCFLPADSEITQYIREGTDNLYIDLNSFLYQAATIISATHRSHHFSSVDEVEDVILRKLFDLLDDLVLRLVQPKALVYIAVDGVSPLGKMSQQRARRRRGAKRPPSSSGAPLSMRRHEPSGNVNELWDGNCISVGTRFMAKVTEVLHFYAVSRTERINAKRLRDAKAKIEREEVAKDTGAEVEPEAVAREPCTSTTPYTFPFLNIVVDDVLRPGEGENKIAEFIRRIRADPHYCPNTAHVICSSDTDVTVTSLILHEPRIHVLRYEPPASLGGKPPMRLQVPLPQQQQHRLPPQRGPRHSPSLHRGAGPPMRRGARRFDGRGGHGTQGSKRPYPSRNFHAVPAAASSSPPPPQDSWLSSFFSIHVFRQRLREILLLAPETGDRGAPPTADDDAADDDDGADRPALLADAEAASQVFEHALHDVVFVLLLFGNDFLPTIGGSIQEGTLDALLSLLATDFIPRGRTLVDPSTNHIQYPSARYLLSCLAELPGNAKKSSREQLQVHNGGQDAMDWGFAAPREEKESSAEALEWQQRREKQQERMCYCYWTMLQWALQYSAGIVEHWGCYYPYGRAPPLSKLATYCGVLSYEALGQIARRRVEFKLHSGRPRRGPHADLGVAPSDDADEEEYDGIDDLPSVGLHTSGSGSAVAEMDAAERGKPTDVMVQLLILIPPRSVALLPTAFRQHYKEIEELVQAPVEQLNLVVIGDWCEAKKRSLSEEERTRFAAYQFFSAGADLGTQTVPFPALDIAFSAYWDGPSVEAELAAVRAEKARLVRAASSPVAVGVTSPSPATAGLQSKAASFFNIGRKLASQSGGGGAAALLASVNVHSASDQLPPSVAAKDPIPSSADDVASPSPLPTCLRHPTGSYVLWVTPCEALCDPLMVKSLGILQGNRFQVGSFVPLMASDAVLSRSGGDARQDVRLRFRLAVAPVITDGTYTARLLPGYIESTEVGMRTRVAAARKEAADQADPWKHFDKLHTAREARKRARQDSSEEPVKSEAHEEVVPDVSEAPDSKDEEEAEPLEAAPRDSTSEGPVSLSEEEMQLQRRKEEARRRLEALKAARLAALQDD